MRRALVWAPVLPDYDRQSGSQRIYDFLRFLREDGWAVTFAARKAGPERYARELRALGIPTYTDAETEIDEIVRLDHYDLAILGFWHAAAPALEALREHSPSTRVIVDSVDLHFLRTARTAFAGGSVGENGAGPTVSGHLEDSDGLDFAHELNVYAAADRVLTVSPEEADLVNDLVREPGLAVTFPDCESASLSPLGFHERAGIVFIGNFRHRPNVRALELLCRDIAPRLAADVLEEHPVRVVGTGLDERLSALCEETPGVEAVGWVPSVVPYLERARLSIVPLRSGAGTKRKMVQALMIGTPTVSTTIGIEGLGLSDGAEVLVSDDAPTFARSIERLARDEELWSRLVAAGRNRVERTHGRTQVHAAFRQVVEEALAGSVKAMPPPAANLRRPTGARRTRRAGLRDKSDQSPAQPRSTSDGDLERRVRALETENRQLSRELRGVVESRTWRAFGAYRRVRARAAAAGLGLARSLRRNSAPHVSAPATGEAATVPARRPAAAEETPLDAGADPSVMKRDWDARARENAKYYVASGREDWDEAEFSASGRASTEQLVLGDLDLIAEGRDPRDLRVLEIGCGVGRMTEHLAAAFGEVHGVDVSGEMIAGARERLAGLPNVWLYETDGTDLSPFADASFDFAFSFIVFQHIPFREVVEGYLREVRRVLKPGRMFKFQVQGNASERFAAAEKNTWIGVGFSAEEMNALAAETGFRPLRSEGAGTQYFWHWWYADGDSGPSAAPRPAPDRATRRAWRSRVKASSSDATPTADDVVRALRDPETYALASELEQQTWGARLSDPGKADRSAADQQAARELRLNRDMLSLPELLAARGTQVDTALSLGCGDGRAERELLGQGVGRRFDGIDIAAEALEVAAREAKGAGFDITYRAADLNFVELEPAKYDLVVAQNCLHHVLELEHVLDQISGALRPNGLLWVHDFVGESQWQWDELRMELANRVLRRLPDELRWDEVGQRAVAEVTRPRPGALASPFESIRSAEIPRLVDERFAIERRFEFDTILRFVCPTGTRGAFAGTEEGRAAFEEIFALDRQLLALGTLEPTGGQYLTSKRDL